MRTVAYKGKDWPVSGPWAKAHLAGVFAELPGWTTDALWDRLWAILRRSDQTFGERTAGLTHDEVRAMVEDPERRKAVIETLTPEELRELRAVEAHIIVRRRVDHLLGRELAEFGIDYIDHAHGQGVVPACGCELLAVMDDARLALARDEIEAAIQEAREPRPVKFMHAHYPRKLCARHAHLQAVVDALGRWHNLPLADRLEHVRETVLTDHEEAQAQDAAAA